MGTLARGVGCVHQASPLAGSSYHPIEVPQIIEECFQQILDKAAAIPDPFEQAFFVLVQLPYLQPFLDVNKRVSRLAANLPLIRGNLCPLSFVDVPDEGVRGRPAGSLRAQPDRTSAGRVLLGV